VASLTGLLPGTPGHTQHAAAKSFMIAFMESLAAALEATGVTATAVCLWFTSSEFHDVNGTLEAVSELPFFSWMTSEQVAREGVDATLREDVVCVDGGVHRGIAVLGKLLPAPVARALIPRQASRSRKSRVRPQIPLARSPAWACPVSPGQSRGDGGWSRRASEARSARVAGASPTVVVPGTPLLSGRLGVLERGKGARRPCLHTHAFPWQGRPGVAASVSDALGGRFDLGGFRCDAEDRAALLWRGVERGAAHVGVAPDRCAVVIVGDTPRDVAAASAIGALSVGVAMGGHDGRALAACGADRVLESLEALVEQAASVLADARRALARRPPGL
jgi:hypothetical protein